MSSRETIPVRLPSRSRTMSRRTPWPIIAWVAVLLVYSEGLSHAEAGAVLGCAEGTVAWRISKAKGRLKTLLEGELQ